MSSGNEHLDEPNFGHQSEVESINDPDTSEELFTESEIDTIKESKKAKNKKTIIFASGFFLLTILFSGVFLTKNNSQVTGHEDASLNSSSNFTNSEYEGLYEIEETELSEKIDKEKPSSTNDEPGSSADGSEGLNVLILESLNSLDEKSTAINDKLNAFSAKQNEIINRIDENESKILKELAITKNLLRKLSNEGGARDSALSKLASVVAGFEVNIKNERYAFPLEVLHAEEWSGKKRVIAYDVSSPKNIIKIYEGIEYKKWILKSIDDSKAVFFHVDANEIVEVAL